MSDKVRFAHISDAHLGHRQYNLKQRRDDMYMSFRRAVQDSIDQEIDFSVFSGDLFHNKDVTARALNDAETALDDFNKQDIPVVGIQGNHDAQLYHKDLNWLHYLHKRGKMVLLEANLKGSGPVYEEHDPENPGSKSGFIDINGIRIFGMQYLGRRASEYITDIAEAIEKVNNEKGEPKMTVLLGHFGVSGNIPGMSGGVEYSDLKPLEDKVDYLGLGHYHKKYEHKNWVFNPGSCEAHDSREARWQHGYYIIEKDQDSEKSVEFHKTKRRPFFDLKLEVDDAKTPEQLKSKLEKELKTQKPNLRQKQQQNQYTANGKPRNPVINLELDGLLQFSRSNLEMEDLKNLVEEEFEALYVNVNDLTESKETTTILNELDGEKNLQDDQGNLNRKRLEKAVFEKLAGQDSRYSGEKQKVAETLSNIKQEVESNTGEKELAESIIKTRRTLFTEEQK